MKHKLTIVSIFLVLSSSCSSTNINKSESKKKELLITLPEETIKSIGLMTEVATVKKVDFKLKFNGIVKEVPNKSFFVASPVNGRVLKVLVEPNQTVSKGEKLAEISSQDVAEVQLDVSREQIDLEGDIEKAKLELTLSKTNYERESKLFEEGITAKKDFLESENRYKIAENNLEILQKKKKSVEELGEKRLAILGAHITNTDSLAGITEVRAAANAVILKRLINSGEVVEKDKILFEASDLKEVFLESRIYERDFPKIEFGEKVTFTTEACPGDTFNGTINFISQVVDPETRTIAVRAKIQNPLYKLKPEMFGNMFINLQETNSLVINKEAVQKVENKNFVYIKNADGFKETKVRLGKETNGLVEIISGIKSGQEIVTHGSFWLKSELHSD